MRPLRANVGLDASLKTAFAEMLQNDAAWVAVLDNGRYLGVLTPDTLHAALRRSVGGNRSGSEAPADSPTVPVAHFLAVQLAFARDMTYFLAPACPP